MTTSHITEPQTTRIWYQSLIDSSKQPNYFKRLNERAKTIARHGVEVQFNGMPTGTYGDYVPAEVVKYPYVMSLNIQFILDNLLHAQEKAFDVFAIGSVQDPGLEEARSLADIPVVGYGEAAMHFSYLLGSRFIVIAFQDGFDQMMDLRIKRLGLSDRALPTRLINVNFADVTNGFQNSKDLVDKFYETARQAISEGAESLIPGQLYLSEAIQQAGITRIDDVPVIDALSTTIKMAEAMTDLYRLGISVTRRGYTHAKPPPDIIKQVRKIHGRSSL